MTANAAGNPTSPAPGACPAKNTKAFAETRFVADVGLAFGAFHHFIYKPYQAGSFHKGASGRVRIRSRPRCPQAEAAKATS